MALDAARLADADFGGLVEAVRAAATTATAPAAGRFAHVDREALQRIVDARLAGAEAPQAARSLLAEAARGVVYMARRGLFHYLRIQWRDGLFRFLLDAPTAVDLERVVVVPGPRVAFAQTDYNRHFTVREIVRDSERGFYNLVHASGLAHLEHYFRVMFFASRLEARFDAELLEGEAYEMRCRVAEITGPLVDVEVAFHSLRGGRDDKDAAAFRVVWRLMLVVDPRRKRMYDFERGELTGGAAAVAPPAVARRTSSRGWTVTRRGRYVTSASVALVLVLVGAYALVPVGVRLVLPLPEMVADALADLSPREAVVAFAFLGVWLRTHPGRQPLHSSVDMLLPHG